MILAIKIQCISPVIRDSLGDGGKKCVYYLLTKTLHCKPLGLAEHLQVFWGAILEPIITELEGKNVSYYITLNADQITLKHYCLCTVMILVHILSSKEA